MNWKSILAQSTAIGGLLLTPLSAQTQSTLPRPTPGSGANAEDTQSAPTGAVPKIGDYVELDEAMKNEMYGTIDFPSAELTTIIKAISKLANKNFILDNKLQNRRITIVSPVPVTKQEAYNAFLSALYMNNLTIVSAGKFLKVVESKTAYAENTRVFVGEYAPASEEVVTVLYPLKNLNADDINRFVVDLIPRTGRVITFPDTNTIVMTSSGLILRRVIAILKAVDIPGHQDQLESIPIQHASAKQIAELLDQILEAQGGGRSTRSRRTSSRSGAVQKTRGGGIITKIVPDERTNSLVVLANGRGVAELKDLIAKLDTPSIAGSGNIHIYYCKNAQAEELATTMSNLIQAQKSDRPSRDGNAPNLPAPRTPNTPSTTANAGDSIGGVQLGGNVRVTADKATNSLVILASASDFAALKQVLTKLDLPRRQVYVEATIMEVAVSDNSEFGIGVNIAADNIGQVGGFLPSTISQGDFQKIISTPAALSGLVAGIATGKTVTVQGSNLTINSVVGLIRAIEDTAQGQILHQPQILISDNEESEINVVDKIPVPKKETVAIGDTPQVNETFEKEEIKISLKITPHIGEDNNLVRLKVEQKVDDFAPAAQGQLKVTERSANTSVTVKDGDTVVIGGLQKRESKDVRSKFPILGDLPILGWLFKGSDSSETKTQLILFLKPRIINQYSDLLELTKEKIDTRQKIGKALYDPEDRHRKEVQEFKKKNKEDTERHERGWGIKNESSSAPQADTFSSSERVEGAEPEQPSLNDLEQEIQAIEEDLDAPTVQAKVAQPEGPAPQPSENAPAPESLAPPVENAPTMIPSFEGDQ